MIIDLETEYGKTFKVERDENYRGEEKKYKVLHHIIKGKNGQHIYAGYGEGLLGVWVKGKKKIAQCKAWGFVSEQLCDNEATFGFLPKDLPRVAQLIKAKRRKKLSPEHRAKFTEAGRKNIADRNLARKKDR